MTGGKYDIIENGVKRMSDMEKILEILGAMNRRMDTMQEDISVLRSGSATKEDVGALKEDIAAHKREMATKEDLRHAKGEMMALMEAYFEPKFDLLAEQIKLIQEKQVPMEAMEQTEDRLDVLEAVVKSHSAEIRRLKKAQ